MHLNQPVTLSVRHLYLGYLHNEPVGQKELLLFL